MSRLVSLLVVVVAVLASCELPGDSPYLRSCNLDEDCLSSTDRDGDAFVCDDDLCVPERGWLTDGCGDGVKDDGEDCDDGNDNDIDACDNACHVVG